MCLGVDLRMSCRDEGGEENEDEDQDEDEDEDERLWQNVC
jgi:hypothetical protein